MPFVSKAQSRWAFANHKPWAKKWAAMTNYSSLKARAKASAKRRKK